MCGIAGLYSFGKHIPQIEEQVCVVHRMTERMVHRGPDAGGVWADSNGRCTLGHRRLSIIDTSDAGRQPMQWNDGEWTITFNGEIYNFLDLKRELEIKGIVFRGRTDTEVLLAGLAVWGEMIFSKLDGMFAFAAFHRTSGQLLLARDPFGEKPLYYFQNSDCEMAFASELQCFEDVPSFSPEVSIDALSELLMFQYVGGTRTIYRNIFKLAPGHYMKVLGNDVQIRRYFQFQPGRDGFFTAAREDLADELESILITNLKRRLISDVPLGAFLSGGVDSSTVCALARKKLGLPLQTFSIGFQDDPGSEHEIAAILAAHLGTEHRYQIVSPSAFDFINRSGELLDEPNADSSCLPTYLLSQFARQYVTVALSGDGGDELFGGYGRYFDMIAEAAAENHNKNSQWSPGRSYYGSNRIMIFSPAQLGHFFGFMPVGTANHVSKMVRTIDQSKLNVLHRLRMSDVENYMPGAVLPKVDRMSMQHSMEVRTPFLNLDLARFAEKLPADYLVDKSKGKLLLRDIAYRYLPREIIDMPKKGFGLPLTAGWGRSQLLKALKESLSQNGVLGNWLGQKRANCFIQHQSSNNFSIYQVWAVVILAKWLDKRPAILPTNGSFASISETEICQTFNPVSRTSYRICGFVAPKVFTISSRCVSQPDPKQQLSKQLSNADMLNLLEICNNKGLGLKETKFSFDDATFLIDGNKDVVSAIKDSGIDLKGCALIFLDPDGELISSCDIQKFRAKRLAKLYVPARFTEDKIWIRYEFRFPSPIACLLNLAKLFFRAKAVWKSYDFKTKQSYEHITPMFHQLNTGRDQDCTFKYAFFEGTTQILPYLSSHAEIKESRDRLYSVWNNRVHYSTHCCASHLFRIPFFSLSWIVSINDQTASLLSVYAQTINLKETNVTPKEALRL